MWRYRWSPLLRTFISTGLNPRHLSSIFSVDNLSSVDAHSPGQEEGSCGFGWSFHEEGEDDGRFHCFVNWKLGSFKDVTWKLFDDESPIGVHQQLLNVNSADRVYTIIVICAFCRAPISFFARFRYFKEASPQFELVLNLAMVFLTLPIPPAHKGCQDSHLREKYWYRFFIWFPIFVETFFILPLFMHGDTPQMQPRTMQFAQRWKLTVLNVSSNFVLIFVSFLRKWSWLHA